MHAFEQYQAERYAAKLSQTVSRIRYIAERVEYLGADVRPGFGSEAGPHAQAAHRAIHEVMWGLANADLDGLFLTAAEADAALQAAGPEGES